MKWSKDIDIFKELFKYEEQINDSVNMVINNTIVLSRDLLQFFREKSNKIKIILSDYGNGLSPKFDENQKLLDEYGICYRISKFYGSDMYYDGWLDFTDHTIKWETIEERDSNAMKCIHRTGRYFIVNDGEIHCCSRGYWRSRNGIIKKIKGEYVDLMSKTISIEEKRMDLQNMLSLPSSESCSRCPGFSNELPRFKPAEQLP